MLRDLCVPAGGRLSAGQLHSAIIPAADPAVARIDLRLAEWVEPVGLVAVAAISEREAQRGRNVVLRAPLRADLARYLSRMRLGRALDALGQEHDLPTVNEWNTGSRLVELRRFTGPAEPDELARMLLERTESVPSVANALHQCVAEIGANVPEHSGEQWGYVAAQTTYRDTVVQFAVGDAGQGVAGGFLPDRVLTDADALDLTLRQGVSRTGLTGHGRGLQKAKTLVNGLGGSVHMASGTAYRTQHRLSASAGSATHAYDGTLLQGSFPVPSLDRSAVRDLPVRAW